GGDIPEAVSEALTAAADTIKWNVKAKKTAKICVLIGDAPPHEGTEAACQATVKRMKEDKGIRTYTVKVTSPLAHNNLETFDQIAAAGGGRAVDVDFQPISRVRFIGPDDKEIPLQSIDRPEAQLTIPPPTAGGEAPGEKILVGILADLINPGYRDRVDPLVRTLLANTSLRAEPEKRLAYVANTPPAGAAMLKPQGK
ncbi:MAG TPA: hypothetical protein VF796_07605, partial [Humisphaera sp.]